MSGFPCHSIGMACHWKCRVIIPCHLDAVVCSMFVVYLLPLGYMRGHGTYMDQDVLFASVAGVVERVNKLISVTPVKTRYNGEIGDVVVGRYDEHY